MYFKLRDCVFEISRASLKLYYYDEAEAARWRNQPPGLFLVAGVDAKRKKWRDTDATPWLRHNSGIRTEISHWTELEGMQWTFHDARDEKHHEAGFLGLFEEEPIKACRFEVTRREGRYFTVRWHGTGEIYYDENDNGEVPFDCEFMAEFGGIGIQQCVADQTEKGLRETLGNMICLDDFRLVTTPAGLKAFVFK